MNHSGNPVMPFVIHFGNNMKFLLEFDINFFSLENNIFYMKENLGILKIIDFVNTIHDLVLLDSIILMASCLFCM